MRLLPAAARVVADAEEAQPLRDDREVLVLAEGIEAHPQAEALGQRDLLLDDLARMDFAIVGVRVREVFLHAGVGSIQHLAGELFKAVNGGLDIVPVPYRGTGPLIADLVGGQVPMGTPGVTRQLIEFHRSGKARILAVTSAARLVAAPELPTAAELGFPELIVRGSIGLLAPAATPGAIVEQVAQATRTAVADPAFQQLLISAGIEPTADSNPEKFRRSLAGDVALWAPIVKAIGVKID